MLEGLLQRAQFMESTLVRGASTPSWDDSLMQGLMRANSQTFADTPLAIGVENAAGDVYRVVRTSGLNETVRVFECARDLGFGIAAGRLEGDEEFVRVLRRNH
jgi:hypothetical protein